jgi:hypothetical protein
MNVITVRLTIERKRAKPPQDLGWKPTTLSPRTRALSALRLSGLGCFAWSKVSSADLHVVENTFKC